MGFGLDYVWFVLIGVTVGFFAGLLGVGGGAIMVPMMTWVFSHDGHPASVALHMALGTCIATIIFTSASSLRAHHIRGAVDWRVVRGMTPGLVAGGFAGSSVARYVPTLPLAILFALFVMYSATQMLVGWKPSPRARLPGMAGLSAAGFCICGFSSLVAIGGAALTIPYLTFCALSFHRAIGTAAALGLPIALASTVGYVINGLGAPGLPDPHLGYVYLPALLCISVTSMLLAPVGAHLSHRSSPKLLRRVFAGMLYVMVIKMVIDLA